MCTVTAIVTCCNQKYETRRALEGIYKQTITPDEVILVDNYSTDGTEKYICESDFPGLKYIKTKKQVSLNEARNLGIVSSECEYVAFLDCVNEWMPTKIEAFKQVDTLFIVVIPLPLNIYEALPIFPLKVIFSNLDIFGHSAKQ